MKKLKIVTVFAFLVFSVTAIISSNWGNLNKRQKEKERYVANIGYGHPEKDQKNVNKPQEEREVYLFVTGYYRSEKDQDSYVTGSYEEDIVVDHYGPIMKVKYKKEATRVKELVMLDQMAQRYRTLKDFLADVAVGHDKDAKDDDPEYLTLSTVHSAQGLEWGRVFPIGLVDGVLPSSRSFIDARAKEELFLGCYTKKGANERSAAKLCRFLEPANAQKTFEKQTVELSVRPVQRRSRY